MALVEKFHVVAAEKTVASGETIKEGQVVSLDTSGEVILHDTQGTNPIPYGIAGDTKSTTASAMPGVGTAFMGNSATANFQSRVSDYFDETRASGMMTVYHSGGEFATDMFASNVADATPYTALYADDGYLCTAAQSTASGLVAYLITAEASYPSGVPGIDINGDQALGGENSNTYIEYKLMI